MRLLQSRRQLNLAAKAIDVESGAELRWQYLDDDVATEVDFAGDEDARHPTPEVVSDLVAIAERALQPLGQISHWWQGQMNSAGKEVLKDSR